MSLQEHETCILSLGFALIVANNAYKSFHRAKSVVCLVLYSKNISYNTTPFFMKWAGLPYPSYFVDGIRTHGIALTITKLIDFYSQGIFTFGLPPFSIEMNQKVNS